MQGTTYMHMHVTYNIHVHTCKVQHTSTYGTRYVHVWYNIHTNTIQHKYILAVFHTNPRSCLRIINNGKNSDWFLSWGMENGASEHEMSSFCGRFGPDKHEWGEIHNRQSILWENQPAPRQSNDIANESFLDQKLDFLTAYEMKLISTFGLSS